MVVSGDGSDLLEQFHVENIQTLTCDPRHNWHTASCSYVSVFLSVRIT